MRLCLILMQKNEGKLLSAWIGYHARISSHEDITIVDNGSTDPETLEVLGRAEKQGIVINRNFPSKSDFENKHKIMFAEIQAAQRTKNFNFIFPLDADEFLVAIGDDGTVIPDSESLNAELQKYVADKSHFRMAGSFYNNPTEPGTYFFYKEDAVFFSSDAIREVDLGYHRGSTESRSPPVETKIAVVHFQYKRLELAKAYAVEKLKNRVEDFGIERMRSYGGMGSHMAKYFYYSNEEYRNQFLKSVPIKLPLFESVIQSEAQAFPYELFFSTDRYHTDKAAVEQSEFLAPMQREGFSLSEILLINKYTKRRNCVAVFRDSALGPFLLRHDVWRVTVIANNLHRLETLVQSFSLMTYATLNRCKLFHVPMGETDDLGFSIDDSTAEMRDRYSVHSPDLLDADTEVIILNGRYRTAIALRCVKRFESSTIYIFPNFWSRPHYHGVLPFFDVIDAEDDLVVLRRTCDMDSDRLDEVLENAVGDMR